MTCNIFLLLIFNYLYCKLHVGSFATEDVLGEIYYYRFCTSQVVQLNTSLPAFHTISYEGSVTTALRLHYHSIPIVAEELFVNDSIDIKHSRGQFQRTFVIDANTEKIAVSFNVRKFFGPTDYCGYGGIRMFNQRLYSSKTMYRQADVPNGNLKEKLHQFIKNTSYNPICSNDSLIFQQKFYLDFGKTFFVFYDFSPMWNIDVTLNVHASKYIVLNNVDISYCSYDRPASILVFNDFFINCVAMIIKLTRQVPFILQWPRESRSPEERKRMEFQCIWPGMMDLTINQNYINFKVYNTKKELCTSNQILRIAGVSNITTILIGTTNQSQIVPNAEYLRVHNLLSNCNAMVLTSYTVFINPSPGYVRCVRSHIDFTVRGSSNNRTIDSLNIASKDCLSLDANITNKGLYGYNLIEQSYNIRLQDNSVYYSVIIKGDCIKSAGLIIFFMTVASTRTRYVHFEFPQLAYYHILYDLGHLRLLQFYLERFSLDCAVYIEFTSSARKQSISLYRKRYFKVRCVID